MGQTQDNHQRDATAELVRDLLILELAKAGVQQKEIRKIVGCDMHRVSRIAKVLRKPRSVATE
jgi:uncharacterized sporulation protein YeaH/YhbH (DUF444 family)